MDEAKKNMCLIEELELSRKLIVSGFGELQEIHLDNDFYHLPQQLLASGLERLMKCYICLVHEARNGDFPDTTFLKSLGHDLQTLKRELVAKCFQSNNIPLLEEDLAYLENDELLEEIIRILSEFGKQARYYNLEIIAGSQKPPIDPNREWEALEREIENPTLQRTSDSTEEFDLDYYPRVNAKIVAKLERFCRAISMQFTLGKHGGRLQQMSSPVIEFVTMREQDFGVVEYRRSALESRQSQDSWTSRTAEDIAGSPWPTRSVSREQYEGNWPFRAENIIVECREKCFCIVNIKGFDFALNGSAKSRFGYPFPHEAGMAVLGKSIGPFIEMSFELSA